MRVPCPECGGSMEGKRPHAKVCSRTCKTKRRDREQSARRIVMARDRRRANMEKHRQYSRMRYATDVGYRERKKLSSTLYHQRNYETCVQRRLDNGTANKSRNVARQSRQVVRMATLMQAGGKHVD